MRKNRSTAPRPNEHLKRERLLRGWTQVDVAGFLGTDGFTVNRWERGRTQPGPYFRQKLCEIFEKSASNLGLLSTSQEGAVSVSSLSSGHPTFWSVPYPLNPFFTGRAEILEALHIHLATDQIVAFTQAYALQGLGGIGKTQLALAYAYQHASEYHAVFWIRAETSENILSSVLDIAEILQLPERKEADQQRIMTAVQHWLSTHDRWLLIWDNLEDLELPQHWLLAGGGQGAVLITTRSQALGTFVRGMDLAPMRREEGMLLMLRRSRVLEREATGAHLEQLAISKPGEYAAASELVTALGGLPLALDQAGAYIEETGCGLIDYLHRYQQQRVRLLDRRGMAGGEHPHSVTATFVLASERAEQENSVAGDLLRVCAFLHAEAIPEELFGEKAAHLGPELASLTADPVQFDQAIAVLRRFSLVQRQIQTRTLSLHRLVQAVLRERMSMQEQARWMKRIITTLNAMFPEATYEVWETCERILPHVLACMPLLETPDSDLPEQGELLYKAGNYLLERGRYQAAEPLLEQALTLGEQQYSSIDPRLIPRLTKRAELYWKQGKYEPVEPFLVKILEIREQSLAKDHLYIAETLNDLALLYWQQGKYQRAEPLYQEALRIREQQLGSEHPETASTLNNLALLYWKQEKHEQAEPFYQRALHIQEQQSGVEPLEMARTLHNLATLYWSQKRYELAECLYQRALRINEQQLGAEHPRTMLTVNRLAHVYRDQGKYELAKPLYQHSLYVQEQQLDPEHPELAYTLVGLATLHRDQGNLEQAEPLYRRALLIQEQRIGSEHLDTADTLNGLAVLYQKQGKYEQARPLYQRALCIREQHLGQYHTESA